MKMGATAILFSVFACLTAHVGATSSARYFDLAFEIAKDGQVISTPGATVEAGQRASMTVDKPDGSDGFRLDFEVEPVVTETGIASAVVSARLHEQIQGEWALVAETGLQVKLDNQPGKVTLSAGANGRSSASEYTISVSAKVIPMGLLSERLGGDIPQVSSCEEQAESVLPKIAPRNCCGGMCKPPPGTMTCCGAISCCACGICCQVP